MKQNNNVTLLTELRKVTMSVNFTDIQLKLQVFTTHTLRVNAEHCNIMARYEGQN